MNSEQLERYSRHLLLPQLGAEGQEKLLKARILLVGAGGLGSPAALYLAAAGVGTLGLVDNDVVDLSNLQRQILHDTPSVGTPKLESARKRLLAMNPDVQLELYSERLTSHNAMRIMANYDVIVDGCDNFPTRYLTNDACVLLKKPNVYGAIQHFDGQASVFSAADGGPCYRCLFPEPPPPGAVPSCAEAGVLGVLPGIIGTVQATEAIKLILGKGKPLIGRMLLYDALEMEFRTIFLRPNPQCPVCGTSPTITALIDYEQFCGLPADQGNDMSDTKPFENIDVSELRSRLKENPQLPVLDVRNKDEFDAGHLPEARWIPVDELSGRLGEVDDLRDKDFVVYCKGGGRSSRACKLLIEAGFPGAINLKGGFTAWDATREK